MPRKKREEEGPKGCPEWMVTFSDVVSLLVTFFVLILTFSTLETQQFQKLSGALQGGFGVLGREGESNLDAVFNKDMILADRQRNTGSTVPFMRDLDDLEDELGELMRVRNRETELQIDRIDGGMRIRIDGDRLFDPNSDRLRSDFEGVVEELGEILGGYPNDLIVEGHVDTTFTGNTRYSAGFELAGDMAHAVASMLIEHGTIAPDRVGVASYGATEPIESNRQLRGRAKNRRVDILIMEQKK